MRLCCFFILCRLAHAQGYTSSSTLHPPKTTTWFPYTTTRHPYSSTWYSPKTTTWFPYSTTRHPYSSTWHPPKTTTWFPYTTTRHPYSSTWFPPSNTTWFPPYNTTTPDNGDECPFGWLNGGYLGCFYFGLEYVMNSITIFL